jgi:hypothetical protein
MMNSQEVGDDPGFELPLDGAIDARADAWLEQLLRADAAREPYIEDTGFTARVMGALPASRRQRSYSWLGPVLGGVGVVGVACFSSVSTDLLTSLGTALGGHAGALENLLLLLAPVAALTYCTAWFAATEPA